MKHQIMKQKETQGAAEPVVIGPGTVVKGGVEYVLIPKAALVTISSSLMQLPFIMSNHVAPILNLIDQSAQPMPSGIGPGPVAGKAEAEKPPAPDAAAKVEP